MTLYFKGYQKYDRSKLKLLNLLHIHQDILKSENLLHKRGFVDSLLQTTVTLCTLGRHVNAVKLFFAHYKFWRNDDHGEHNYSVAIFIYGSNSPN